MELYYTNLHQLITTWFRFVTHNGAVTINFDPHKMKSSIFNIIQYPHNIISVDSVNAEIGANIKPTVKTNFRLNDKNNYC
jgi:hypothetical protein